ncbi:DUF2326 domain-containing protein [Brevibacillus sp. NRRL NRS-603]|nr:DUF2326 domain-containing protein [Brevibacillus sp. NRRL NRS-603]PSK21525.1 hypothetical protein C7R94_00845 [Brevibacillus sp. NRRL NRS-603]
MLNEYTLLYEENKAAIVELNARKSNMLSYINATHSFEKFKLLQQDITELKVQIESIKTKINSIDSIVDLNENRSKLESDISKIIVSIKEDFFGEKNKYIESIRKHFNNILMETLGDAGVLSTPLNKKNNVEFISEIIDMNTSQVSSKDKGTTYKKLMCCAFDLAILATYASKKFIHFVYHDGVFDGLDSRQKENFYKIIKEYSEEYNIQYIFSTIQDELPESIRKPGKIEELKNSNTIIKSLHDEGNDGRLFKMEAF